MEVQQRIEGQMATSALPRSPPAHRHPASASTVTLEGFMIEVNVAEAEWSSPRIAVQT